MAFTEREIRALSLRHGAGLTYKAVGEALNVGSARAAQIVHKAERKVRFMIGAGASPQEYGPPKPYVETIELAEFTTAMNLYWMVHRTLPDGATNA